MSKSENQPVFEKNTLIGFYENCDYEVDATDLVCPLPLLKMKQALNHLEKGHCLLVKATDPASERDFKVYIQMVGHQMEMDVVEKVFFYKITKN